MAIKDEEFIRGEVPLTKSEVRAVCLSKLNLQKGDHLLDIGAGTGGITLEAAVSVPEAKVTAIDNNNEAVKLIILNTQQFEATNINIVKGTAPDSLQDIQQPTKVFIGGSKGKLPKIFAWIKTYCKAETTVVANAITLETLETLKRCIKENDFAEPEIIQLSVNRLEKMGNSTLLKAQNPIFIVTTSSPSECEQETNKEEEKKCVESFME